MKKSGASEQYSFLAGGGEMGALTRNKDWTTTPVGDVSTWPQSLRTTLSIILNSKFPMFLWWGDDLIQFYNDAYRPSFGNVGKHPTALGQKAEQCWPEIWAVIKPLIDQVRAGGEATWSENQLIPIYRNGRLENVYWTFSYSPVKDESGAINGVLVVCNETTTQIDNLKKVVDSEKHFRDMINDSPVSTIIFRGPEFLIELANEEALTLLGKDKSIIGKKLIDAIPELKGQPFPELLNNVYTTGEPYIGKESLAYFTIEGKLTPVYINYIYRALYDSDGKISGIFAMGYNVTEQVEARNKINEAEERTRLAVDAGLLGTFDLDIASNVSISSKRLYEIYGFDEAVPRETLLSVVHPDDAALRNAAFNRLMESGILNYEIRIIWKKDKSVHWISAKGKLFRDEHGKPIRLLGTVADVTSQKIAANAVEEASRKFRHTVRQAPVAISIFRGPSFIVEMANDKMLELWNKTSDQVINKKVFDGVPEAADQGFEQILTNVYTKGERHFANEVPVNFSRKNGVQQVFINFVYEPLREDDGTISGITAVAADVTQQVQAKQSIQENEKQFRNLIMPSPIAIAIFRGRDMVVELANQAMLKIWQREGQFVRGRRHLDLLPEMSHQKFPALMDQVFTTGVPYQENESLTIIHHGDILIKFYLSYLYAPLFEGDGKTVSGLIVTINDVTELVEARQQARDAADRLTLAAEGTKLATWDLDLKTHAFIHSPRLALHFGHAKEKILTHPQTRSQIHAGDLSIVETAFDLAMETGAYQYEARVIHPDASVRWVRTEGKVIYDEQHVPLRLIGTMRDITEEKSSEEKVSMLASIVQSSNDAIISKTLDGIITSWNDGAHGVFGYTAEEVVGKHISILIPPDRLEEEPSIISRLKRGERVEHFETQRVTKGKKLLDISLTISPIKDAHGKIIGASKIARDISEQKRVERLISESEERLQIVVDASELGTWELNIVTGELVYSKRYSEILGYHGRQDLTHAEFFKHLHPDDLDHRNQAFANAYKTGSLDYRIRMILNDGSLHWVEVKGKVFYDEQHHPIKLVGTARDLTEEITYQQRIEESEHRFRVVADTAPAMIWMADTDTQRHFFNRSWLSFTGRTLQQESGNEWTTGVHPDDLKQCLEAYLQAFHQHEEFYLEYRLKRVDGEYRWISENGAPRFTTDGVFEGYIGACMDIHERTIFEEKLKESESRLRIAALSSELGTWYYNPITKALAWDNATRELYGVDAETPVTVELFFSKVHPEDQPHALQKMLRALDPEVGDTYDAEYRLVNLPGNKTRWIHAKGKAFFDENRVPYLFSGTVLDITEKQIALSELRDNEKKFRLLADSMPQLIWTADKEGNLNYFNQSVYDYSGLTFEKIKQGGWLQIIHPGDLDDNNKHWDESINTGKDFFMEHRFLRHDGQYRWQSSRAMAQFDTEGKVLMWVGTSTDIHDQKLMTDELEQRVLLRTQELKHANDELARSNTELASFSYVASHDLQEPLRKIQTFATRLLENEKNLSETGKDYFKRMQSASLRMQTLINDLLTYSRINTNEKQLQVVDLNTVLDDVINEVKETIDDKKAVIENTGLPTLKVIQFQFRQLLTNLIGNALKFSKPDSAPRIRVEAIEMSGEDITAFHPLPKTNYYKFTIADNGIGFEQKYSDLIFQVFQRLHGRNEYTGTGIGLSICKKIIENHHGFITASGVPQQGATFTFYIPI